MNNQRKNTYYNEQLQNTKKTSFESETKSIPIQITDKTLMHLTHPY